MVQVTPTHEPGSARPVRDLNRVSFLIPYGRVARARKVIPMTSTTSKTGTASAVAAPTTGEHAVIDGKPTAMSAEVQATQVLAIVRAFQAADRADAKSIVSASRGIYGLEQTGEWFTGSHDKSMAELAGRTGRTATMIQNYRLLGRALVWHGIDDKSDLFTAVKAGLKNSAVRKDGRPTVSQQVRDLLRQSDKLDHAELTATLAGLKTPRKARASQGDAVPAVAAPVLSVEAQRAEDDRNGGGAEGQATGDRRPDVTSVGDLLAGLAGSLAGLVAASDRMTQAERQRALQMLAGTHKALATGLPKVSGAVAEAAKSAPKPGPRKATSKAASKVPAA